VTREFARNRLRRPRIGNAETKRSTEKPHLCAIFDAFSDVRREHRMAGWGAWIRTREWRNQNPVHLRENSVGILKCRRIRA
jgi:hypothetical protein